MCQQVDSRTGATTYAYRAVEGNDTDQVESVTDPAENVTATYGYYTSGQVYSVTNAGSHTTYYAYDAAGRLKQQWGAASTPVEYSYTAYGEVYQQKTFRSGTWTGATWPGGTADTTTYTYDGPSGFLTQKQDAEGRSVDYTYNSRGLVETRKWSRLNTVGQRVQTTYSYQSGSTELTGKTYNDGTPAVSFTYTRLGQLATATDIANGTGVETRNFEYDAYLNLTAEKLPAYLGSRWISYTYEDGSGSTTAGRPSGYQLGVSGAPAQDLKIALGYDSGAGRVATVTATHAGLAARTFTYGYKTSTSLLGSVTASGAAGYTQTRDYESDRDRLQQQVTGFTAGVTAQYDYTYNTLGQRESAKQSGAAFADFGNSTFYRYVYNAKGELIQAAGYLGTDVTATTGNGLPGRNFAYGYDPAGNRTSANSTGNGALAASYTPNSLNQIAGRENLYVPVSGTVDAGAQVVAGGQLMGRQGKYWGGEVFLDNNGGPVYTASLAVKAAKSGTVQISSLLAAFLPMAAEGFTYDRDGNVTSDGQWSYAWDAENRLVSMETTEAGLRAGLPGKRLTFRYDSQGRRTVKQVWEKTGGTWSLASEARFVYQGWNVIAELSSSGIRQRTYAWGLDLGGSLDAMGGIGALLQAVDHTGTAASYLPAYDGSGNVTAMASDTGMIVAAYEYSPFGESLRKEGGYAKKNPFRQATKYTDEETGLVYYGMRYYSPALGRFLGRDPIGEHGGPNLYGFCGNDPVNGWDVLGMLDPDPRMANDQELSSIFYQPVNLNSRMIVSIMEGKTAARFYQVAMEKAADGDYSWLEMYDIWNGDPRGTAAQAVKAASEQQRADDTYTVTYHRKTGTTTGSVGGRMISFEMANGFGGDLDQLTGNWGFYAPNSGGGVSALTNAKLSQGIYDPKFTGADGFNMVAGSLIDDPKTGLRTAVFSDGTHYVQVFAGTSPSSWANWWANLTQAFGFKSAQYEQGMQSARDNQKLYGDNLSFTGHSLGGGIASASAIVTGLSAVTFNAAGVHNNTIGDFSRSNGSITSYYSTFDVLHVLNWITPSSASVPGQRISLGAAGFHGMASMVNALEGGGP